MKNNNFTLHSLRHSYATHLMNMDVDLMNIDELLGRKTRKTTKIYTPVCKKELGRIINPLDDSG